MMLGAAGHVAAGRGGATMCRRVIRALLLVIGSAVVLFAALPVLAFVHFKEPLQTELMASKLLLPPVGALCFVGVALLSRDGVQN